MSYEQRTHGGGPYEPPRMVTMTSGGAGGGRRDSTSEPDARSICMLIEPVFTPDGIAWHGMTIVGGKTLCDITGSTGRARSEMLDHCLYALYGAGEGAA